MAGSRVARGNEMTRKLEGFSRHWRRAGRFLLAAIFIYAGILKMVSPQDFSDSLAAYRMFPVWIINWIALALPPFEIVCGMLVLTGFCIRIGMLAMVLMSFIFTGTIIIALTRGISIDCGCFGESSWMKLSPWVALPRDMLLLLLSTKLYCDFLAE